nr:G2/mitotic-specific cyclin-B-like isoform X1 [Onthophagus taurus]XP_022921241.1 G2/mitotic-specific cyclin-B-like isoform X2 [Onthophagus taurus]
MSDRGQQRLKGPFKEPERKVPIKVSTKTSSQENISALTRVKSAMEPSRCLIKARRPLNDVGNDRQVLGNQVLKKTNDAQQIKSNQIVTTKITSSTVNTRVLVEKRTQVGVRQKVTTSSATTKTITSTTAVPRIQTFNRPQLQSQKTVDVLQEVRKNELEKKSEAPIFVSNFDTSDDPQMVSVYINDIFANLRELELRRKDLVKGEFLNGHRTKPKIRQVLIDWLVDVHSDFKLALETLHLTVSIIDEYLEKHKEVGKETLQLVGVSALFIAAKYEDIYPPDCSDLGCICDNAFSKSEIIKMEQDILKTLNFNLTRTYSIQFLRRFNQVCEATEEQHSMGKYLLELALLSYETCHIRPSLIAAAVCCISKSIENRLKSARQAWTPVLIHFACYKYEDIEETILKIADILQKNIDTSQQSIKTKYSSSKFNKVSVHPNMNPNFIRNLIGSNETFLN